MPSRKFIMYSTSAIAPPKFKQRNYMKEVMLYGVTVIKL